MKIKREINGEVIEIELTKIELSKIRTSYKVDGFTGVTRSIIRNGVEYELRYAEILNIVYRDDIFVSFSEMTNSLYNEIFKDELENMIEINPEVLKINPPTLKDGDIVSLQNGNDGIVFQNYIHFGKFNKSIETSSYNIDLEFIDLSYDNIYYDRDDYKIIKVKSSHYSRTWKREE